MSINRNLAKFASKVSSDGNSYISITVTVAQVGGSNKYHIDGTAQQTVSLAKGVTYRFDVSDSTVSGHPFVFSTDSSNSSAFTTGVTSSGSAGSANAYVEVTLEQDAPDRIYYYCSNHAGMGGMVKTAPVGDDNFASFVDTFTFPTSDGSANQILKTDGSGALGFVDQASGGGGSGGTVTATASGALTDGMKVVLLSDGTVSAIGASAVTGSVTGFHTTSGVSWTNAVYDANAGKVVIVYQANASTYTLRAAVATVSGSTLSFGSSVAFATTLTDFMDIEYDANAQKVVIIYNDGNDNRKGKAIVGTVSGSSISFGSEATFNTSQTYYGNISYDANAQKHLICFDNNSSNGQCLVGSVSGTSISFGSTAQFDSGWSPDICLGYDAGAQKHLIAYRDNSNSNSATAIVATISGTSVSYGTTTVIDSRWLMNGDMVYDSGNAKLVICADLYDSSVGSRSFGIVATISGTDVTFGTASQFNNSEVDYGIAAAYHASAGKIIVNYEANAGYGSDYPHYSIGTVSGTSITWDTAVQWHTQINSGYMGAVYDSGQGSFVLTGQMNGGRAIVVSPSYSLLTSENFIGISDDAYANGASATIQVAGSVDDAQSGLTAGQSYYVQTDGSLALTPDDPSVFAGTALSATKLLINPDNVNANFGGLNPPTADGTANQVLKTDGSGQLGFTTIGGGGGPPSGSTFITENRSKYSNGTTLVLTGASDGPTTYYIAGGTQFRHVSSNLNSGYRYRLEGVNLEGIIAGRIEIYSGGYYAAGGNMYRTMVWDDSTGNFLGFPTGSTYDGQNGADDRLIWGASGSNYTSGGTTFQPWSYKLGTSSATSINFGIEINAGISGTVTVAANETVDLIIFDPSSPTSYIAGSRRWFACKLTY